MTKDFDLLSTSKHIAVDREKVLTDPAERRKWFESTMLPQMRDIAELSASQDIPLLMAFNVNGSDSENKETAKLCSTILSAPPDHQGPLHYLNQGVQKAARGDDEEAALELLMFLAQFYPRTLKALMTVGLETLVEAAGEQKQKKGGG